MCDQAFNVFKQKRNGASYLHNLGYMEKDLSFGFVIESLFFSYSAESLAGESRKKDVILYRGS